MQSPLRMRRTPRVIALLALASACESAVPPSPAEPTDIPAATLRSRHAKIAMGDTRAEVADAMGSQPVRRPGHPDAPFPTPLRVADWTAPSGEPIRLEVYVTATRPADGCPDLLYDDAPVAYADGRVVATTWEEVEWRWRGWGGELARLRALQDRVGECEAPDPKAPGPTADPKPPPTNPEPALE
jgi:hypothetical protein